MFTREQGILYATDDVLGNRSLVYSGFKNRRCSKMYYEERCCSHRLEGKIISKAHYDAVVDFWAKAKEEMKNISEDYFSEEDKQKYAKLCEKIEKIKNTDDWKLVGLYAEFIKELKKENVSETLLEKADAYLSYNINKEYEKLYKEYKLLNSYYEKANRIDRWLEVKDKEIANFLKGTVVETEEQFMEEMKKLNQNNKR